MSATAGMLQDLTFP